MVKPEIVLATNNQNKVEEFHSVLGEEFCLKSFKDKSLQSPEEYGGSFVENALLKARFAARSFQSPAIADDSGLIVDCLNGEPGVKSARYANSSDTKLQDKANISKLLQKMSEFKEPKARLAKFISVIVGVRNAGDEDPIICKGYWYGYILPAPVGNNGFGYDPVFYCFEKRMSAGDMSMEEKMHVSHRARALKSFKLEFFEISRG